MAQEFGILEASCGKSSVQETLERLVAMTIQTNLVALDKTVHAVRRADPDYALAAARVSGIRERLLRAVWEVGETLREKQRFDAARAKDQA
ncbi:MAG: hypothetical protein IPI58_09180 [Alphaproteobacteria bacterium]|nr:MAG: hypothetical protein IPI58_09180 [Alphaproteobacteria bacterium]